MIAAVTVGQDLIKASQLRSVITQIQNYDTQVATFKVKHDALPGDIANATARGLNGPDGNGDGVVTQAVGTSGIGEEVANFWKHLEESGLTNETFDGDTSNGALGETIPKLKSGGGVIAYGNAAKGENYYLLGFKNPATGYNVEPIFTPEDAFSLDSKLDDGYPLKGNVLARYDDASNNAYDVGEADISFGSGAANDNSACVYSPTGVIDVDNDEYNFQSDNELCLLRIGFNN